MNSKSNVICLSLKKCFGMNKKGQDNYGMLFCATNPKDRAGGGVMVLVKCPGPRRPTNSSPPTNSDNKRARAYYLCEPQ